MRGDKSDLRQEPLQVPSDAGAPIRALWHGTEDDLIACVLESVHSGSKFRSPFLSASTCEKKANIMLREAKKFKTNHTGPDPDAHIRRIDLSKLHPGQVIPFAADDDQKRLIGKKSCEDRFNKYFTAFGPGEVAPTRAAEQRREYLLVARGYIPESLFKELLPQRSKSAGP
jgi:hypothetical protein